MGKVRAAMLAKWRRGAEKTMTDDGRSRMELLNELVPVARRLTSNDPAQMAVAEFMKLQHEFEAEDILYSTLQVAALPPHSPAHSPLVHTLLPSPLPLRTFRSSAFQKLRLWPPMGVFSTIYT